MGLGDLVAGAVGLGGYSGSNLKGFLSKFNSAEANYINTIDPLHTFDVSMAFFPKLEGGDNEKGFLEKVGDKLLTSAVGAAKNALNNLTGGLLGALMNDVDILKLRDDFVGDANFGKTTFIDYIARGNMLVTDDASLGGAAEKSVTPQLIIDISYYVQNITLPQITTSDGGSVDTLVGSYPINGIFVKPSQNSFQLNIINTKAPLMERLFYPWMKEVTLPFWSYENQPYTTANIEINFEKHSDFKYLFVGCRPSNIETLQPSNELGMPTRQVTLIFDHMFVKSDKLKTNEDLKEKLVGLGTSALNDLGSSFGL